MLLDSDIYQDSAFWFIPFDEKNAFNVYHVTFNCQQYIKQIFLTNVLILNSNIFFFTFSHSNIIHNSKYMDNSHFIRQEIYTW